MWVVCLCVLALRQTGDLSRVQYGSWNSNIPKDEQNDWYDETGILLHLIIANTTKTITETNQN